MTGLFRENAVKNQSARLSGNVNIATSIKASLLFGALLVLVAVAVVFLFSASFNRKESVVGYIEPSEGLVKLFSYRSGTLVKSFISNGDSVEKGDPIALIKSEMRNAEGILVHQILDSTINSQILSLQQSKQNLSDEYEAQITEIKNRLRLNKENLKLNEAQSVLLQDRIKINIERLNNLKSLFETGAISNNEYLQQKELVTTLNQELSELNRQKTIIQNESVLLDSQLTRLPLTNERQLLQIKTEIASLEKQKSTSSGEVEYLITAEQTGRVTNFFTKVGQRVFPDRPLLSIIPENSKLRAVLLVPTRAYGFIDKGQKVRVRYDAFPYQRFGLYEGEVYQTENSILLPNEVNLPIAMQEPVYRVDVSLANQEISAYGDVFPLQPGMTISADIVLEQRSLINWLLEPILSLKGRI